MNRALWTVGLSVLVSFCAVAMDTPKSKLKKAVANPFKSKLEETDKEEEFKKASNEAFTKHYLLQFKITTEREKFAKEEEKSLRAKKEGLQEKRLPAKETPANNKILFDNYMEKGNYDKAVDLLEYDSALKTHYPRARVFAQIGVQINAVFDGSITGGFCVELPDNANVEVMIPKIGKAAVKAAQKGKNKRFLKVCKEAKKNSSFGKEISSIGSSESEKLLLR